MKKQNFFEKRKLIQKLLKAYLKVRAQASTMALCEMPLEQIKKYVQQEQCHGGICHHMIIALGIRTTAFAWIDRNTQDCLGYWGPTPETSTTPEEIIDRLNIRIKILKKENYKFW